MAKETKGKKRKGSVYRLLLRLAVAGAAVYLLVTFVSGQMQVTEKQRQLVEINALVERQAEQNAELERLMESGDEDAYVERVAREKLGYARPDERVFVDISGK